MILNFKKYFTKETIFLSLLITALLLLYTAVFSMSFSYMGNTDTGLVKLAIKLYWHVILLTLLKIVFSHFIIVLIIVLFLNKSIEFTKKIFPNFKGFKYHKTYIVTISLLIIVLQLFKKIIIYPQMFIDTFYKKNIIFAWLQEALTNNINPIFFEGLVLLIVFIHSLPIIYFAIKKIKTLRINFNNKKNLYLMFSLCVICVVLFSVWSLFTPKVQTEKKNVIIIASDALRPDHFSGYGYELNTTPNIDKLIKNGVSFRNVITAVPRTFPSWVSTLTSSYPFHHKISHMFPDSGIRNYKRETVVDQLNQNGYYTSVCGDFAADIFPRMDLGFKTVKTPTFNMKIMLNQLIVKSNIFLLPFITNNVGIKVFPSIREFAEFADPKFVTSDIISEIDKAVKNEKPFFITGFYSITHFPFSAPYPYYNRYTDKKYTGESKYLKNRNLKVSNDPDSEVESKRDIEHVRSLYDGGLYGFDENVGIIVKYLKTKKLLKNTIIIITSDHGENLYENNNGLGHGEHLRGLYSLRVPLIFAGAIERKKSEIFEYRSTIDIAPTICNLLKVDIPQSFKGKNLFTKNDSPVYSETGLWFDTGGGYFFQKRRIMYPGVAGTTFPDFKYYDELVMNKSSENLAKISKHRSIIIDNKKMIYQPMKNQILYDFYTLDNNQELKSNFTLKEKEAIKRKFFNIFKDNPGIIEKNNYIFPVFYQPEF